MHLTQTHATLYVYQRRIAALSLPEDITRRYKSLRALTLVITQKHNMWATFCTTDLRPM
jgi:hypothetical protein